MSILAGMSPDAIDDTEEEAPAKGSDAAKRAEAVRVAVLTELKVRGPLRYSEILEALPMVKKHHLIGLQKENRAVCTGRAKASRWSVPLSDDSPPPVTAKAPFPRVTGDRPKKKTRLVTRQNGKSAFAEDKEPRASSFRDTLIRKRESLARKIAAIDAFLQEFYG